MRVALLFNTPSAAAGAAESDVLDQVAAVQAALTALPAEVTPIGCTLALDRLDATLRRLRPDLVFNLVEALAGSDRLVALVPALLDVRQWRYTGSDTHALASLVDKVVVKLRLRERGIPTPDWFLPGDERAPPGRYIIKPRFEHGSVGIDAAAVVDVPNGNALARALAERGARTGLPVFAERFVDGREFNLSLLQSRDREPDVLPAAEIRFDAFPAAKPRIVGYAAKWEHNTFEYVHTPRSFEFAAADQPLLERLACRARAAWHVAGVRGYARVDFRVDAGNQPYVLEVNANPCLTPDAGFAAAAAAAGMDYSKLVARIVGQACSCG